MAAAAVKPPFPLGQKEVFLPSFRIIFHRTGHLGPRYATFTVPLWFNKLDLRDYLFNAYNVRVLSIRSYIKQLPVELGPSLQSGDRVYGRQYQGRLRRPKSIKRMTVELESPFQWPEEPEDQSPWEGESFKAIAKRQQEYQEREGSLKDAYVDKERRKSIREQAQDLLDGKTRWASTANSQGPVLGER